MAQQKRLQEEMVRINAHQHLEVWERTVWKFEVMTEKVCKLTQSSDTKSTNMIQDWEHLLCLIKRPRVRSRRPGNG